MAKVKSLIQYNIVTDDGEPSSVTAFIDGKSYVASAQHPNFKNIVQAVQFSTDVEKIIGLFNAEVPIGKKFAALGKSVTIKNGTVHFKGKPVDSALAALIAKFHGQGHPQWQSLVNFMEKIEANPDPRSREQLFTWLQKYNFAITPDGDFIAYKGVHSSQGVGYLSSNSGRAIVNGTLITGKIPTHPDSIVEMPRNEVDSNPDSPCSTGLHAGNYSYAKSFAPVLLRVKINPRDVCAVPRDGRGEKIRVCRYRVLGEFKADAEDDSTFLMMGDVERTLALRAEELAAGGTIVGQRGKEAGAKKPTTPGATVERPDHIGRILKKAQAAADAEPKGEPEKKVTRRGVKKSVPKKAAKAVTKTVTKKETRDKTVKKQTAVSKKPVAGTKKGSAGPAKRAPSSAPRYYEDFKQADFASQTQQQLRWLAKEWALKSPVPKIKADLAKALASEARRRAKLIGAKKKIEGKLLKRTSIPKN